MTSEKVTRERRGRGATQRKNSRKFSSKSGARENYAHKGGGGAREKDGYSGAPDGKAKTSEVCVWGSQVRGCGSLNEGEWEVLPGKGLKTKTAGGKQFGNPISWGGKGH